MLNSAPSIGMMTFSPSSPKTNEILTVQVSAMDMDFDPITFNYDWRVNGATVKTTNGTSSTTDTLDLSQTGNGNKGDSISVYVTPFDPYTSGMQTFTSAAVANSAPILTGQSFSTPHDQVLNGINLLANAADADADSLEAIIAYGPYHGTLTQHPNAIVDYTPDPNWTGIETISVWASDGIATSMAAGISINVGNSAPTAVADSYTISHDLTMDTRWSLRDPVLANDTDADGDPLTAVLVSAPAHATVWLEPDGSFDLTPENHYVGQVSFTYQAFDGLAYSPITTVMIQVTNVAPTDVTLSNRTIKIYDAMVGTLTGIDQDYLETFTYALVNTSAYPDNALFAIHDDQLTVASSGLMTPGSYTVQVQATDGIGASTMQTFTISVENVAVWISSVQDAVEGVSAGYFRLRRSSTAGELTAAYTIKPDQTTAIAGVDYAALSGSVTFVEGQEYADIVVVPNGGAVKFLAVDLVSMPGGVGVAPLANRPLLMGPPPNPDAPPPALAGPPYTFSIGERSPKDVIVGQVTATSAAGHVSYSITDGNTDGYFAIDGQGKITVLRELAQTAAEQYLLTVRATDYNNRHTDFGVTIHVMPLVLIYGDLQGVMAPIGNNGLRDRITLTFIRISRDPSWQLTVNYAIDWDADAQAKLENASVAALRNGVGETGSITFRPNQTRKSITLTPQLAGNQFAVKNFWVTVTDQSTGDYLSDDRYEGMDLGRPAPGWSGWNSVAISVLPKTKVFGSNNNQANLRDSNPDGTPHTPGINLNDIDQGSIGDCSFLAAIGAMAQRVPSQIEQLFIAAPSGSVVWADGTVLIKLFTQPGVNPNSYITSRVYATLDFGYSQAELSTDYLDGATAREYEIWTQMLEKFYARHIGWERFLGGFHWSYIVWKDLTGLNAQDVPTDGLTPAQIEANVRAALTAGEKLVVTTSSAGTKWIFTIPGDPTPYTIFGGHAYVVQSIDANGIVTLYNPHGPLPPNSPVKFRIADFKTYFNGYQKQSV